EESLTIFLDKQKLNKKSEGNSNSSVVSLELLHQLAASYFTDRESTLRRLHHLQIATSAIKVLHLFTQHMNLEYSSKFIIFASVPCQKNAYFSMLLIHYIVNANAVFICQTHIYLPFLGFTTNEL
ncbi:hypothetical protein XENOCAPTIV_016372, partial [Xenoophorus captivus]